MLPQHLYLPPRTLTLALYARSCIWLVEIEIEHKSGLSKAYISVLLFIKGLEVCYSEFAQCLPYPQNMSFFPVLVHFLLLIILQAELYPQIFLNLFCFESLPKSLNCPDWAHKVLLPQPPRRLCLQICTIAYMEVHFNEKKLMVLKTVRQKSQIQ